MFNNNYKKEMKRIENQQKAKQQLNDLQSSLKQIEKLMDGFYVDAKDCLVNNDNAGFELIANSIFYFQDISKVLNTVRIQFQTYIKTSEVMDTIEGIRPILKQTAKMMSSYPSFSKNNKDFLKFKKALLRGQLNMKAMASMLTNINPAMDVTRSKEELDQLKERIMVGADSSVLNTVTNTDTNTGGNAQVNNNDDFFSAINAE